MNHPNFSEQSDESQRSAALLKAVTKNFSRDFQDGYAAQKGFRKQQLLPYALSFYRRWYASALIEDTLLSPAYLYETRQQSGNSMSALYPVCKSATRMGRMTFVTETYTLADHPVLRHLRAFLDFCRPDFEIDKNRCVTPEHEAAFLNDICLKDPFYARYLARLAFDLNLVEEIPSIYTTRAQVSAEAKAFFRQPPLSRLARVVEATASQAVQAINGIIPANRAINNHFILGLLREPKTTDDIFKTLYLSVGIDIDDILDLDRNAVIDETAAAILSSTFLMGVAIDKYFFTPFGFYLKLISPGYLLRYNVEKEMDFALSILNDGEDAEIALFAPCSHFRLTNLGFEYFGLALEDRQSIFPEGFPLDALISCLTSPEPFDAKLMELLAPYSMQTNVYEASERVYRLKIVSAENEAVWKTVEILEKSMLHDLYLEVCFIFDMEITMNYSLFRDTTENPFTEFCSPFKKAKARNTNATPIMELAEKEGHSFILAMYDVAPPFAGGKALRPQRRTRFLIRIEQILPKAPEVIYPRLVGESPAVIRLQNRSNPV